MSTLTPAAALEKIREFLTGRDVPAKKITDHAAYVHDPAEGPGITFELDGATALLWAVNATGKVHVTIDDWFPGQDGIDAMDTPDGAIAHIIELYDRGVIPAA